MTFAVKTHHDIPTRFETLAFPCLEPQGNFYQQLLLAASEERLLKCESVQPNKLNLKEGGYFLCPDGSLYGAVGSHDFFLQIALMIMSKNHPDKFPVPESEAGALLLKQNQFLEAGIVRIRIEHSVLNVETFNQLTENQITCLKQLDDRYWQNRIFEGQGTSKKRYKSDHLGTFLRENKTVHSMSLEVFPNNHRLMSFIRDPHCSFLFVDPESAKESNRRDKLLQGL